MKYMTRWSAWVLIVFYCRPAGYLYHLIWDKVNRFRKTTDCLQCQYYLYERNIPVACGSREETWTPRVLYFPSKLQMPWYPSNLRSKLGVVRWVKDPWVVGPTGQNPTMKIWKSTEDPLYLHKILKIGTTSRETHVGEETNEHVNGELPAIVPISRTHYTFITYLRCPYLPGPR